MLYVLLILHNKEGMRYEKININKVTLFVVVDDERKWKANKPNQTKQEMN